MSRTATALSFAFAVGCIGVVLGAAACGLAFELVRRGVVRVLPWGRA